MWSVKTGGLSWQWSLKTGFTVVSLCLVKVHVPVDYSIYSHECLSSSVDGRMQLFFRALVT